MKRRPGELREVIVGALRSGPASAGEIAVATGCPAPTVSAVLERLIELNRAEICGWSPKRSGVRQKQSLLYRLRPDQAATQ